MQREAFGAGSQHSPPSKVAFVTCLLACSLQLPQARCRLGQCLLGLGEADFQAWPLHIHTLWEANPHGGQALGLAEERGHGEELGTRTSLMAPQQRGRGWA